MTYPSTMENGFYVRFDDYDKMKYTLPTLIIKETDKRNIHSPIYFMNDDWDNLLNLRDIMYLSRILEFQ